MIPLLLSAEAEADAPFVTRLRATGTSMHSADAILVESDALGATFAGKSGLFAIDGATADDLDGDVVLVRPQAGRLERLLRSGSPHNTLLVTERCDQLCVMCSQPPKKTHDDRFDLLEQACLLAEPDTLIGISGGEPTLYKDQLLGMVERVLTARPDLSFHILTNAQHFDADDISRLRGSLYRQVSWGIPLYAAEPALHDEIVGKRGAFAQLEEGFAHLIMAGARVELRTVLVTPNHHALPDLARYVAARLPFVEAWSIMQLENIGFAKGRWSNLYVDHRADFRPIGMALTHATLHNVRAQLFNFPRCTVPADFRNYAIASISDWKRKFASACGECREQSQCSGFFEWHPNDHAETCVEPL
jgi:His-Xaa-Ser system radical SAM maturase HxsC